jgi:ABC-type glycerol-3-phosphate transport system permease component
MAVDSTSPAQRSKLEAYQLRPSRFGQTGFRRIRLAVSYVLLILGACFMLFPLLWMLSASFKPEWQIFTRPPIWIPQEWIQVQAGNENTGINTYTVERNGEETTVIRLGRRRYTSVVGISDLEQHMITVPQDQLTAATTREVGEANVPFNVRTWNSPEGAREVVAIGRAGDDLAVIELDKLTTARVMPLTVLRTADRVNVELQDVRLQAREVEIDGETRQVLELGPESELVVVSTPEVAEHATIALKDQIEPAGSVAIGATELDIVTIAGDESGTQYVNVSDESWQPVLELDIITEHALTVPNAQLTPLDEPFTRPNLTLPRYTWQPEEGDPQDVVGLLTVSGETIILPDEYAEGIRLGPLAKLTEDQTSMRLRGGGIIRIKEGFEEYGEIIDVALFSQPQEMALLVPLDDIPDAFEADGDALKRNTRPRLRVQNYRRALTASIGGANFLTFFRNSGIVVVLNLIGNFLSCTVVAYAFARLRAPGKNILFAILLSTLMLPFPVTLIPVYEIFRNLGMIDSLWPLFLRSFFGNAFFIFLLRQFFMSIPVELEEAARIDGASTLQILTRIVLPLSTPALATMAIFTFLGSWNDFFTPYVFINSPSKFTATLGLNLFKGHFTTNYEVLMAASTVVIAPTIILFFFLQRYFIEGIQLTGLKG